MIKSDPVVIEFDVVNHKFKKLYLDDLDIDSNDNDKIYWIHYNYHDLPTYPNQQHPFQMIVEKLKLPYPIIELFNEEDKIPKTIDNGESLSIRIQCLQSGRLNSKLEANFENLVVYLTPQYCLTLASDKFSALDAVIESYSQSVKYAQTPCFILFLIFDSAIDDYAKILRDFELSTDQIDLRIRDTHENIYDEVTLIKKQLMNTKRSATAIRDILMRISGRKISVISDQCRASLSNLLNHNQMVVAEADAIRDMLNGILDQIDNALMQRLNVTMKVLTGFSAIFLPLSLIAGIYGMNFRWIPELNWQFGYLWAIGLMFVCGLVLLFIFKRMKWF